MGLDIDFTDGATELDDEEKQGLKLLTITTRKELDEFEQRNIEEAMLWTIGRKFRAETIFSEKFLKDLHKRMYADVWNWAGNYRQTQKNIGVDWWQIPTDIRVLLDDALFWFENKSFPEDEIAIRFKHRLVSIHCFLNGNGRHSRLIADIIAEKLFKLPVFSWGQHNLSKTNDSRNRYLKALKKADLGDYSDLIEFARS